MRRLAVVTILMAGALAAASILAAPAADSFTAPPGCANGRFRSALETVRDAMADGALPSVSLAVGERGQITCEASFGWADLDRRIAATPATMYSLASISKPFTATAVMRFVQEGRLDLDLPANAYLGAARLRAFEGSADAATLRRLLTHTAGLPLHYQFFYAGGPAAPPMDTAIGRYGIVVYPPGERYFYSNFGYGVLERIVERTGQRPFAEVLRTTVLDPLGLRDTVVSDGAGLDGTRAALRYAADAEPIRPYTFDHVGASGVWSSARDLVRFGMFHLGYGSDAGEAPLSIETRRLMQRAHAPADGPERARGLGWSLAERPGRRQVAHSGSMPGVATILSLYPEGNVAIAVLTNVNTGSAISRIERALADAVLEPTAGRSSTGDSDARERRDDARAELDAVRGRWEGWARLPGETIRVALDIRGENDARLQIAGSSEALFEGLRLNGTWLTGRTSLPLGWTDAAPEASRAAHATTFTLALRGERLSGWASTLSQARPTYGAVSFPVSLSKASGGHSAPQPLARDGGDAPSSIRLEDLRRHLAVLSADSLEGRGAGYPGEAQAAAYIAGEFERLGLRPGGDVQTNAPTFLQRFSLHPRRPVRPFEILPSQNVIGILDGSDPRSRHDVIVVGAHYDGQGRLGQANMGRREEEGDRPTDDAIWNSANDNGAAVAALLELAEWAAARRPARTVVFVAFGAEEHGLVGSLHYTAHPTLAWERHTAMINLEMLGWAPDQTLNVRATDTSPSWPDLVLEASRRSGVAVTLRQPQLTNDTDHYGFAVRGVPAIHYGVGGSRRHYHRVTDDVDGIAFAALARRTHHVAALLDGIASRPAPIPFGWRHPPDPGITGTSLTIAEMEGLALPAGGGGVKITAVAAGLAAARAGLRGGDVVVAVDGDPLPLEPSGLRMIQRAFADLPASGSLRLSVMREGTSLAFVLPSQR